MIRLTVNPEAEPTVLTFQKPVIIIGSGTPGDADVPLADEDLETAHIKIIQQDNRWFVVNNVNDPFATLNGLPFGKKQLKNGDLLRVGNTSIRIDAGEQAADSPAPEIKQVPVVDTKETLLRMIDTAIYTPPTGALAPHPYSDDPLPRDPILPNSPIDDLEDDDDDSGKSTTEIEDEIFQLEEKLQHTVHELMTDSNEAALDVKVQKNETQQLDLPEDQDDGEMEPTIFPLRSARESTTPPVERIGKTPTPATAPFQLKPPTKPTLKDYYLSEFDDENEAWKAEKQPSNPYASLEPKRNWRLLAFIAFTLLLIVATILGGAYLSLSGRSEKEELMAAEGVADVAMALTYAQVHHISPHKQNWSDPDFLRNSLNAILTSDYPSLAAIDSHGQFSNCPYILRIYTSSDLSQFLVIAQPASGLVHWMIPKTSIVVDSRTMEMRRLRDIKALNRLLVHANTLDGTNAMEVTNAVKQGELIPLASLTTRHSNHGFVTPTALGLIRPGAENKIYNAPRYYPFGESLLHRALSLADTPATSHDLLHFVEQIEPYEKLKDFVLYSSEGMQIAMEAQKALAMFAPNNKFLIAYLVFNSKGFISGSHLLIDDDNSSLAAINKQTAEANGAAEKKVINTFTYALESLHNPTATPPQRETLVADAAGSEGYAKAPAEEERHPLSLQMTSLTATRHQALLPLAEKMATLLAHENQLPNAAFHDEFMALLNEYETEDKVQQDRVSHGIAALHREYTKMPMAEFMEFIKAAKVEPYFEHYQREHQQTTPAFQQAMRYYETEQLIEKIKTAQDLQDLALKVQIASAAITLDNVPDASMIIAYQGKVSSQVETVLSRLLLSQDQRLPQEAFTAAARLALIEALKSSWITDSDVHEFYLKEFDAIAGGQ